MTYDRAQYGKTRALCEFLTDMAYAMEISGGLDEGLSDRMDELIEPIRTARDWLQYVGRLMSESKSLPADFDSVVDVAEIRALAVLPQLKAMVDEACDTLVLTTAEVGATDRAAF
jgi:hypothetical protein